MHPDECAARIARAEADLADYREQLHRMVERYDQMSKAALSAAATAEVAITRLIAHQKVAQAAEKFVEDPTRVNAMFALAQAVEEMREKKPS